MDEIRPQYSNVADGGAVFSSTVVRSAGPSIGSTIDALDNTLTSAGQNAQLATPWYSDQVLPFDITLSGANEMGAVCSAKIFGLEILNEGWASRSMTPSARCRQHSSPASLSPCRPWPARSQLKPGPPPLRSLKRHLPDSLRTKCYINKLYP
jgi:hypothetical protein